MESSPFRRYLTGPFRGLRDFEREFAGFGGLRVGGQAVSPWAPPVDVWETGDSFVVRIEMPGLARDEIRVSIEPLAVVVEGERQLERESNEGAVYISERSFGSFYRRVALPAEVQPEGATAVLKDGVLTVRAKRVEPGSRRAEIPVEVPDQEPGDDE